MTVVRGLLLLALGAAAAVAADRVVLQRDESTALPGWETTEPGPDDPPLVWLSGTIEELDASELTLREGQGPILELERLAEGATAFLAVDAGRWRELAAGEVDLLEPGSAACVETLMDGRTLLALRVFLGTRCGPAGPA